MSLKHYFQVHDQPFSRTAIYMVILGLLLTVLSVGLGLAGYAREAPKQAARQAEQLEKALGPVAFQDGKASAEGEQPRVLWECLEDVPEDPQAEERKRPPLRLLLAVLDTTGKVTTCEQAAAFAGCPEPRHILLFGPKGIQSFEPPRGDEKKARQETCSYADEKRLDELRALVRDRGGKPPEFTSTKEGVEFALEKGKVHVLLNSPELMVLVDTTPQGLSVHQARWRAVQENPAMQRPGFLVLIAQSAAALQPSYENAPRTLEFAGRPDLDAAMVARWVAQTAQQANHEAVMRGLLPNGAKMAFYLCFELFVVGLICSVAGLVVSGFLRAGIGYVELLTIALYAMTPARLVLPFLMALARLRGQWVMALPFVVGMVYAALGTHRTARELGAAPAPKL